MAPYVAEVIGVDPDEDMLAQAARQAGLRGVDNARWVAARAEELPAGLGEFRAVVFAQSFHWTDRDETAAVVREMLVPGGAFVHVADLKEPPAPTAPLPRPAPPYERIGELVRRYLGPVRRAGQGTLINGTPGREDLVLARAGFVDFERHVVAGRGRAGPSGGLRRGVGVLPVGLRAPSVRRQTGGLRAAVARAAAGGGARRAFRGVSAADRDHDLAQATNFYRRVTSLRVLTRA